MSSIEILVIVVCLAVGYWVVSQLDFGNTDKQPPRSQPDPKPDEKQWQSKTSAPWHEVLNVSPDATEREIESAHKTLLNQYRPDKNAVLGSSEHDLRERKTKEINTAYAQAMAERGR
ncbi:MAG: J domain-containing protein [Methylobacillus sp.]|jgi:DnaJ-domain-containing protein 1|nr:J domain-containing protein [Methylobacillus sp.]